MSVGDYEYEKRGRSVGQFCCPCLALRKLPSSRGGNKSHGTKVDLWQRLLNIVNGI